MFDQDVVESLLSEVPSEVFDAIKPLSDRNSQAVFIALLKNNSMRFGDLKELFKVKGSEEINHPLKALIKAGIVSKKAERIEDIGNYEIAIYCPTVLGKLVMRSLYVGVMSGAKGMPINLPLPSEIQSWKSPSFEMSTSMQSPRMPHLVGGTRALPIKAPTIGEK